MSVVHTRYGRCTDKGTGRDEGVFYTRYGRSTDTAATSTDSYDSRGHFCGSAWRETTGSPRIEDSRDLCESFQEFQEFTVGETVLRTAQAVFSQQGDERQFGNTIHPGGCK